MRVKTAPSPLQEILAGHAEAFRTTFSASGLRALQLIAERAVGTFKSGNKILLCGNGGSAADAQHIAAEFVGRFQKNRKSLPAIALTTDTSILTAVSNDYSYDRVFERQVEALGTSGDLLIAISTSGNSKNVIQAAKKAKQLGLTVVGFTGRSGGQLKETVDLNFSVDASKTSHIQEIHITALHAIAEWVEDALFSASG